MSRRRGDRGVLGRQRSAEHDGGPDGLVWFIEDGATAVARVNAYGSVSEFPWVGPTEGFGNSLISITPGPDGDL